MSIHARFALRFELAVNEIQIIVHS